MKLIKVKFLAEMMQHAEEPPERHFTQHDNVPLIMENMMYLGINTFTDAEHMNEGGPRIFIMSSTYIMHIIWAVLMGKEEAGSLQSREDWLKKNFHY